MTYKAYNLYSLALARKCFQIHGLIPLQPQLRKWRGRRNKHLSLPSSLSGSSATYWPKEARSCRSRFQGLEQGRRRNSNDGDRQLLQKDLSMPSPPFIPSNPEEHLHLPNLSTGPRKNPSSPEKVARIIHLAGLPWTYFFHVFHEISGEHSCWLSPVRPQQGKRLEWALLYPLSPSLI